MEMPKSAEDQLKDLLKEAALKSAQNKARKDRNAVVGAFVMIGVMSAVLYFVWNGLPLPFDLAWWQALGIVVFLGWLKM